MPVRVPLPINVGRKASERACVQALHDSGDLYRLHMALAARIADYSTSVDRHGTIYSADVPMSDNTLFLLLRADAGDLLPSLPPGLFRKIVRLSIAHIRREAAKLAQGDERVPVVISDTDPHGKSVEPLDSPETIS